MSFQKRPPIFADAARILLHRGSEIKSNFYHKQLFVEKGKKGIAMMQPNTISSFGGELQKKKYLPSFRFFIE